MNILELMFWHSCSAYIENYVTMEINFWIISALEFKLPPVSIMNEIKAWIWARLVHFLCQGINQIWTSLHAEPTSFLHLAQNCKRFSNEKYQKSMMTFKLRRNHIPILINWIQRALHNRIFINKLDSHLIVKITLAFQQVSFDVSRKFFRGGNTGIDHADYITVL